MSPLDLHVLGTPPAFVLSQDRTLPFNPYRFQQTLICLRVFNSLESSLSFPIIARLLPLYRFQGSLLLPLPLAPFGTPARASLAIIPNLNPLVNPFFQLFLKKIQVFQGLRTFPFPPLRSFGFPVRIPDIPGLSHFPIVRDIKKTPCLLGTGLPHPDFPP